MVGEVLEHLEPSRGGVFVDCTIGLGGHTRALLDSGAARVIGIDRDRDALARAADGLKGYEDRIELVHGDYRQVSERTSGQMVQLVESLSASDPARLEALRAEFDALVSEYFDENLVRQDYLLTRATKIV